MDAVQNKKNIFEGAAKVAIILSESGGEKESTKLIIRLCKCDKGEFLHNYSVFEFSSPETEAEIVSEILI